MELFTRGPLSNYLANRIRQVLSEFEKVSEDEVLRRSTDDLVSDLVRRARLTPLEIGEEPIDGGVTEGTVPQKDFGSFWSADAPTSVLQTRYDKAILPEWYDKNGEITAYSPLSMGYTASFPEGTTMYTGTVRRQIGLDGTVYPGGTPQVLIPQSYKHGTIIDKWELELK